jgi:hypothetical protein
MGALVLFNLASFSSVGGEVEQADEGAKGMNAGANNEAANFNYRPV